MMFHFYKCGCVVSEEGLTDARVASCDKHKMTVSPYPCDGVLVQSDVVPEDMAIKKAVSQARRWSARVAEVCA